MKVIELLMVVGFVGICLMLLLVGADRIDRIENGEMTLVSQEEK